MDLEYDLKAPLKTLGPGVFEFTEEIKKSRFLARACRVDCLEEIPDLLRRLADPEANHNCFAYVIGEVYRFSDDGEPGGSAGRPIHAAIDGLGLDHVLVVVTRWFGGVKLGVGGLVRAYGGAASLCLKQAEVITLRPKIRVRVQVPFELVSRFHHLMEPLPVVKLEESFGQEGAVWVLEVDAGSLEELTALFTTSSRGRVQVIPV